MSMGQRQAREKSIQRRAAQKAERKQRRRRLRQAGARSGAAVAVTALGLSGLGMAPALAASTDPHVVADIQPGGRGSAPGTKAIVGNTVFFAADTDGNGTELWKSDGTAAGTVLVKDIYPGSYTDTYVDEHGVEHTYTYPNSSAPFGLVAVGNVVFFSAFDEAHGRELWKSDGTPGGTTLVKDINENRSSMYGYEGVYLAALGDSVYFAANDDEHGRELWRSNGTVGGTSLVTDLAPGSYTYTYTDDDGVEHTETYPYSSWPSNVTAAGGTLFFSAEDARGRELWKSDGTGGGTSFVKDINPGTSTYTYTDVDGVEHTSTYPNSSNPRGFVATAGTVFFAAEDASGGELWKTNGTEGGTTRVKDIYPGSVSGTSTDDNGVDHPYTYVHESNPTGLAVLGGVLYFAATDQAHGRELWRSTGTDAGTTLVKDINPGQDSGVYDAYHAGANAGVVGTSFFFSGNDGTNGAELWRSDGTAGGTTLAKDLFPGTYSYVFTDYGGVEHTVTGPNASYPGGFAAAGSVLFFSADEATRGRELWVIGVDEPATGGGGGGGGAGTPAVNPACAPATTASANAASAVAKAKAKLKKAKKSHNAAKIKKAKAKLKKAKKAATAAAANQSASCA